MSGELDTLGSWELCLMFFDELVYEERGKRRRDCEGLGFTGIPVSVWGAAGFSCRWWRIYWRRLVLGGFFGRLLYIVKRK